MLCFACYTYNVIENLNRKTRSDGERESTIHKYEDPFTEAGSERRGKSFRNDRNTAKNPLRIFQ
ncbi:MAG TPA: hypothetical protein DCE65_05470 [Clostridiales bacterium]|nr:hypothetical protein [Clostridiales bacterium]